MFEKIFLLVKSNASSINNNPLIPAASREAMMNDASSSIIEVLKMQMENGRIGELIKFFKFSGTHSATLVTSITNKFANKLNNFYNMDMPSAHAVALSLIPSVMKQLVQQSNNTGSQPHQEFALPNILAQLNSNRGDLSGLMGQLSA